MHNHNHTHENPVPEKNQQACFSTDSGNLIGLSLHGSGVACVGKVKCSVTGKFIGKSIVKGDKMSKQKVMSEEVFEAMLDQAIEDLHNSGLDASEVFTIVEEQFGNGYARRFCNKSNR